MAHCFAAKNKYICLKNKYLYLNKQVETPSRKAEDHTCTSRINVFLNRNKTVL
jgi:hypothetical protein